MIVLTEGDLAFTIDGALNAWKFDEQGKGGHGLSHCMNAVDFIVETPQRYDYIEVKGGSAKVSELVRKYRDSFLYEWASQRAEKPVYYWVVIGNPKLQAAELLTQTDNLKRQLPMNGPQGTPWLQPFVYGCGVFDIQSWNQNFPNYQVARLTGGAAPAAGQSP